MEMARQRQAVWPNCLLDWVATCNTISTHKYFLAFLQIFFLYFTQILWYSSTQIPLVLRLAELPCGLDCDVIQCQQKYFWYFIQILVVFCTNTCCILHKYFGILAHKYTIVSSAEYCHLYICVDHISDPR